MKIAIRPRPTAEEINTRAQEIIAMPPGPERDTRLSQAWYLAWPEELRSEIWSDPETRLYFIEIQRNHPGWIEADFSILHIAVTGETPIY